MMETVPELWFLTARGHMKTDAAAGVKNSGTYLRAADQRLFGKYPITCNIGFFSGRDRRDRANPEEQGGCHESKKEAGKAFVD